MDDLKQFQIVTPEGLRARAELVRGKLNDGGSCAAHFELAADEITSLRAQLAEANKLKQGYYDEAVKGWERARSTEAKCAAMAEALKGFIALDECEAHFEDAYERLLPEAQAALSNLPARAEALLKVKEAMRAIGDDDKVPAWIRTIANEALAALSGNER